MSLNIFYRKKTEKCVLLTTMKFAPAESIYENLYPGLADFTWPDPFHNFECLPVSSEEKTSLHHDVATTMLCKRTLCSTYFMPHKVLHKIKNVCCCFFCLSALGPLCQTA